MGRAKNENIRKIQKVGGTYTVSLPILDMRKAKWKERQKVVVEFDKRRKRFIIKDWKK
tara:strand:+ start:46 stop:219 length:174 start_codon:yes stop_codon:yes gene_type:complete